MFFLKEKIGDSTKSPYICNRKNKKGQLNKAKNNHGEVAQLVRAHDS